MFVIDAHIALPEPLAHDENSWHREDSCLMKPRLDQNSMLYETYITQGLRRLHGVMRIQLAIVRWNAVHFTRVMRNCIGIAYDRLLSERYWQYFSLGNIAAVLDFKQNISTTFVMVFLS